MNLNFMSDWENIFKSGVTALKPIVVIGGGAAGLMAAGTAGKYYDNVILIEKNNKLGKKLYITGKGRCNVTNINNIKFFMENIVTNPDFLYSALYSFDNNQLINLLEKLGVKVKVERGGRVFPVSDRSEDIVMAFKKYLKINGIKIIKNKVIDIESSNGTLSEIYLKNRRSINPKKIIIATGGLSYPETGSTGDGYKFAEELGHQISKLQPALVPLEVENEWVKDTDNLTLKNISIKVINKYQNKEIYHDIGELTFTDYGFKGPLILSASSYMGEITPGKYEIVIDLKPGLSSEKLDERILRDFKKYSRKNFSNSLKDLLPVKLIPVIIKLSKISAEKTVHQITRSERKNLLNLINNLNLRIKKYVTIKKAIITSGGVKVEEINPATMESKIIEGLYFAGEIIDVDALTGGYNLQIAFSTGYLAGLNAARTLLN